MAAATLEYVRRHWKSAPSSDELLQELLDEAWAVCEEALPAEVVADPGYDPKTVGRYQRANMTHAQDLYKAEMRDATDLVGGDSFAVRVRPLSAVTWSLLRPERGRPSVG